MTVDLPRQGRPGANSRSFVPTCMTRDDWPVKHPRRFGQPLHLSARSSVMSVGVGGRAGARPGTSRCPGAPATLGMLAFRWLVVACLAATLAITWPLWQVHSSPPMLPALPLPAVDTGVLLLGSLVLVLLAPRVGYRADHAGPGLRDVDRPAAAAAGGGVARDPASGDAARPSVAHGGPVALGLALDLGGAEQAPQPGLHAWDCTVAGVRARARRATVVARQRRLPHRGSRVDPRDTCAGAEDEVPGRFCGPGAPRRNPARGLSPVGHNWNQAVWPWNVALAFAGLALIRPWRGSLRQSIARCPGLARVVDR